MRRSKPSATRLSFKTDLSVSVINTLLYMYDVRITFCHFTNNDYHFTCKMYSVSNRTKKFMGIKKNRYEKTKQSPNSVFKALKID